MRRSEGHPRGVWVRGTLEVYGYPGVSDPRGVSGCMGTLKVYRELFVLFWLIFAIIELISKGNLFVNHSNTCYQCRFLLKAAEDKLY